MCCLPTRVWVKCRRGSAVLLEIICTSCDSQREWWSQKRIGNMPDGNLRTAAAILFSGCNTTKALNLFRHAKVKFYYIWQQNLVQSVSQTYSHIYIAKFSRSFISRIFAAKGWNILSSIWQSLQKCYKRMIYKVKS